MEADYLKMEYVELDHYNSSADSNYFVELDIDLDIEVDNEVDIDLATRRLVDDLGID